MFKLLHRKAEMRDVLKGTAASPNAPLLIQHTPSGQNLAVETIRWMPTLFGAECPVTCRTMKNQYGVETAENIWKVLPAKKVDMTLFVRAAKGEQVPLDGLM